MKEILNISVCQTDLQWEAPAVNMDRIASSVRRHLSGCPEALRSDLIVLPEFFTTGFTSDRKYAEPGGGRALCWMKAMAEETGAAFAGSVPVEEGGKVYNRLYFVRPDGTTDHYDKRHLFRMSREPEVFSCGTSHAVAGYLGWKIGLNVCYDLRFPVWSRNAGGGMYDIMVNVASWPASRIEAASVLARARAVENQAYFIFCNRTGDSPEESYRGGSAVFDFKGRPTGGFTAFPEMGICGGFLDASLDLGALRHFREKFPVWMDADKFDIIYGGVK